MKKKIRFAIIGASGIAPLHIKALQNNPFVDLVYIFSRDIKRSRQFARNFGLIAPDSYEAILRDETIDAVDIVTEPTRHAELALKAIDHGKHVLIEKPLDTNISMAKKLVEKASRTDKVISVISQKRFDKVLINMKKKLEAGDIGKPFLAEIRILWKRTDEYYHAGNGWRSRFGNVLINQAVHWVDVAMWFFGKPKKIYAKTKTVKKSISCYDTAVCCFEFPNNVLLSLSCSTAVSETQPDEFVVYGTKGIISYNSEKNKGPKYIKKAINFLKRKILGGNSELESQIYDFVEAIIKKRPPKVLVSDAYASLSVVKSCENNMNIKN